MELIDRGAECRRPPEELSPKQLRFCELYAQSGNGTQAAIAAGYSRQSAAAQASRLLKNRKVRQYLDRLQTKAAGEAIADIAEVQSVLSDLLRDTKKPPAARIGAANLLLKSRDAYTPPDEPLPDDPKDSVQIVLPWDGRSERPNAVRFRGVVTPLQTADGEDQEDAALHVLEYIDLMDKEKLDTLQRKEHAHNETNVEN